VHIGVFMTSEYSFGSTILSGIYDPMVGQMRGDFLPHIVEGQGYIL
jgi:hypothetical protein